MLQRNISLPIPTAQINVTAEIGFILMPTMPMKPPSSMVVITTITMTSVAAQGLNIKSEITANTANAMIQMAMNKFQLKFEN